MRKMSLKKYLPELSVFLIVFAVFAPSLFNGMVSYDDPSIFANVRELRNFSWENLFYIFTHRFANHYHPITELSFQFDFMLWKGWIPGFHLTSVLFHSLASVLLFRIMRHILGSFFPNTAKRPLFAAAMLSTLFFALHPLRVESVSWISERKDVLCTFFYFSSILAFFSYRNSENIKKYLLSVLLFLLACLSKSMAVSIPAILLLSDIFVFKKLPINPLKWFSVEKRKYLYDKIPYLIIAFLIILPVLIFPVMEIMPKSYAPSLGKAIYAFITYPVKTLLPLDLAIVYDNLPSNPVFYVPYLVGDMALIALPVLLYRKYPVLMFSLLFYAIAIFPVIGILNGSPSPINDRYCYIPSVAFSVIFAVVYILSENRIWRKNVVNICVVAILLLLSLITFRQQAVWKSTMSLYANAILKSPYSSSAHSMYGEILYTEFGNKEEAFKEFDKALLIDPDNSFLLFQAAEYYYHSGIYDKSLELSYKCYQIDPESVQAWQLVGQSLYALGRYDEAENVYRTALDKWERVPYFAYLLAELYISKKDLANAEIYAEKSLGQYGFSEHPDLLSMLAGIELLKGNNEKAADLCRRSLSISPNHKIATERLDAAVGK